MRPVYIFGVCYQSLRELQQAYPYLSVPTLSKRINRGLSDEEIVAPAPKGPIAVVIDDKFYPSVASAAKDTSVPYPTYLYRAKRAMDVSSGGSMTFLKEYKIRYNYNAEKDGKRKAIVIEGVCYPSYKDAAIALNINYQTLVSRIKNGWYAHDNGKLQRPPHKKREKCWGNVITYEGVEYRSHSALARAYGVEPGIFRERLARGCSMEVALQRDVPIVYQGVSYASRTELARAYNVDVRRFFYRLNLGYSIEDALSNTPSAELRLKYKILRGEEKAPVAPTIPPVQRQKRAAKKNPSPEVWNILDDLEDIDF